MMYSLHPRIRIVAVLLVSYVVSTYAMNYVQELPGTTTPAIQFNNIASDLSQSITNAKTNFITSIQSIQVPIYRPSTLIPPPEDQYVEPTQSFSSTASPWTNSTQPTNPPIYIYPTTTTTSPTTRPRVTRIPPTPRTKPTRIPPTTAPKPTKKPVPSPTPLAPPEYIRPGKSLEDIYSVAGQMACVPPALLKAFVAQEGPGALSYSDETALFYNAYDWWHRAKEVKQVCGGYGYHTETGLIPSDSLFAGEKCKEPFNQSTTGYDSGSMGATQILQSYWDKTYKDKVKQKLKVGQADRRVLLDALVGFGLIVIDNTKYSGSCTNWEFKYVIKAACANAGGSCEPYNYCYTICNNYNKYSGQNNNCNNVKDLFVPGSYCQLK